MNPSTFFAPSFFAESYWPPAVPVALTRYKLDALDGFVGGDVGRSVFDAARQSPADMFSSGPEAGAIR